jgi:hypothetical protein
MTQCDFGTELVSVINLSLNIRYQDKLILKSYDSLLLKLCAQPDRIDQDFSAGRYSAVQCSAGSCRT